MNLHTLAALLSITVDEVTPSIYLVGPPYQVLIVSTAARRLVHAPGIDAGPVDIDSLSPVSGLDSLEQLLADELLATCQTIRASGVDLDLADWRKQCLHVMVSTATVDGQVVYRLRGSDVRTRSPERSTQPYHQLLESYLEQMPFEVYIRDPSGRYLFVNRRFRFIYEPDLGELFGKMGPSEIHPEFASILDAEDRLVLESNEPHVFPGIPLPNSPERAFEIHKFPVHDGSGKPVAVGGVVAETTERMRSEAALAASEEQLRLAFDYASEGIATISLDGVFVRVNQRLCEILGRSPEMVLGRRAASFNATDDPDQVAEVLDRILAEGHHSFLRTMVHADGRHLAVRLSVGVARGADGEPSHFVAHYTDESERQMRESRTRQSEQLEAIGRLAGGIAHDINNLLSGIVGYAELLGMQVEGEVAKSYCEQLVSVAGRAADFTSRLLSFARVNDQPDRVFDLHAIVDEVVDIARWSVESRVAVHVRADAEVATVLGEPSQIHSAILNLVLNAFASIVDDGTIELVTGNRVEDGGTFVWLDVVDNGVGIEPGLIHRVFEPFYSTRPEGRGTGLGLTSVAAAANGHGGSVTARSEVGSGSTFRLELPVSLPTDDPEAPSEDIACTPGARVMVVDDDEAVRFVVAATLQNAGCTVSPAGDGSEAISMLEEQEAADELPDVVVFDLRMSPMGGSELAGVLKQRWPGIGLVLMSGFTVDEEVTRLRERGLDAVLQKPFANDDLLRAVALSRAGQSQ